MVRKDSLRCGMTVRGPSRHAVPRRGFVILWILPCGWKRKVEDGSPVWSGLEPDLAAVPLDDSLADRESDSGALVFLLRVEALKDLEHALALGRVDSDPVVTYRQEPTAGLHSRPDVYLGSAIAPELDGVAQEVLKQLAQLGRIAQDGG